jgi:flagellar biosynthesis protein FlhG
MDLSEVAQRTKISERYLRSIESERFDELPAPVYVRGFITQFARFLRIDPARASEHFLKRFRDANGDGGGTPILKEL